MYDFWKQGEMLSVFECQEGSFQSWRSILCQHVESPFLFVEENVEVKG